MKPTKTTKPYFIISHTILYYIISYSWLISVLIITNYSIINFRDPVCYQRYRFLTTYPLRYFQVTSLGTHSSWEAWRCWELWWVLWKGPQTSVLWGGRCPSSWPGTSPYLATQQTTRSIMLLCTIQNQYIHTDTYMYIHTHTCTYTHIHVHTHTYTQCTHGW